MFGRAIPLFKLMGFEVRLDASWIILAFLITWSLAVGYFPAANPGLPREDYWAMAVVAALALFLSIVVHEFAHSVVARSQGLPMRGITLFVFGGVAEMGLDAALGGFCLGLREQAVALGDLELGRPAAALAVGLDKRVGQLALLGRARLEATAVDLWNVGDGVFREDEEFGRRFLLEVFELDFPHRRFLDGRFGVANRDS